MMSFVAEFGPLTTSAECERRTGKRLLRAALASLSAALVLTACGGGGDSGSSGDVNFSIDVMVGGQVLINDALIAPGGSLDVVVRAGQSVTIDAGEPVVWTLLVGGNAIRLDGTDVHFAGADIGATTLSPSTIALDIFADFLLPAPVSVTLIATSTFDSAQVATIDLVITN
jgi:hypothetical protein